MEHRPFGPEEKDEKDPSSTDKKRRGGSFLAQYLARRKDMVNQEQLDTENKEDDTAEKPKKWRKKFKSIFKKIVEPPEGHTESKEGSFNFNPDLWFSWQKSAEEFQVKERDTIAEKPPGNTEIPKTYDTQSFHEPKDSHVVGTPSEKLSVLDIDTEPEKVSTTNHSDNSIDAAYLANEHSSKTQELQEHVMLESFEKQAPDKVEVEKEVVIERGVGSALPLAAVGLEYLARKKADRRIEKKMSNHQQSVSERLNKSDLLQGEIRSLANQNREQLEQLKQHRGLTAEQKSEVREINRAERPTMHRAIHSVELASSPLESRKTEPSDSKSPELNNNYSQEVPPEHRQTQEMSSRTIMEQVAAAAEKDTPIEIAFEKSHEVKDDQTTTPGAVSVGAIMAQKTTHPQSRTAKVMQQPPSDNLGLPTLTNTEYAEAYQQAARAGFFAAVAIIILGTIAYLMVK